MSKGSADLVVEGLGNLVEDGERTARLAALGEAGDEVAVGDGVRLGPGLGLAHQAQDGFRLAVRGWGGGRECERGCEGAARGRRRRRTEGQAQDGFRLAVRGWGVSAGEGVGARLCARGARTPFTHRTWWVACGVWVGERG